MLVNIAEAICIAKEIAKEDQENVFTLTRS